MGLFSGKLMSDRKARKLAGSRAQLDAALAANPDALKHLPGAEADVAEWEAFGAEQMAERQKIESVQKRGAEAPAVMHSLRPTEVTDLSGGRKFEFEVSIQLPSGESHRTQISQHMAPWQIERFGEGRPITVKYDPDEPDNALFIDW